MLMVLFSSGHLSRAETHLHSPTTVCRCWRPFRSSDKHAISSVWHRATPTIWQICPLLCVAHLTIPHLERPQHKRNSKWQSRVNLQKSPAWSFVSSSPLTAPHPWTTPTDHRWMSHQHFQCASSSHHQEMPHRPCQKEDTILHQLSHRESIAKNNARTVNQTTKT